MVEPCSWCFCVHLLHHLFDSFHLIPLIKNLPIRGNGEVYVVEESTVNGGLFEIQPTLTLGKLGDFRWEYPFLGYSLLIYSPCLVPHPFSSNWSEL